MKHRGWLLLVLLILILSTVALVRADTFRYAVFYSAFADGSCRSQTFRYSEDQGDFVCKYAITDIYCPNGSGPCQARDTPDESTLPFCSYSGGGGRQQQP
jgi:hypothetical protein